ncbi:MAG TPA: ATP-dependent sacrificial sulfur transferase LarE [Nitrospirae bacterium]|nr:ATP-dependent sacrificial sulfur transferase LarE [Nitrospirota bacterium]
MQRYKRLLSILGSLDSAVVACSGGVDSTLLMKAAKDSNIKALAVTGKSPTIPSVDLNEAISMASEIGLPHRIIRTAEMQRPEFRENNRDRCFFCKDTLFGELKNLALKEGYLWVVEGSNLDDLKDYRPGLRARDLHGVRSPLIEARFTKEDIREISRALGLKTWNRPASPCLSSRFPYGLPITEEELRMVEEAESFLRGLGFSGFRVRHHGDLARIEGGDIERFFDPLLRKEVVAYLRGLGYKYISLDLEGFMSGKLNR